MASDFVDYSDLFSLNCFNSVCKVRDYFRQKQEKSLFVSPEVISNTPNRNLDTPKVFLKCTPKVGQKTFGVYYVKEETQEAQPIRLSSLYAYDRRWL